jgi:hypothetical protein
MVRAYLFISGKCGLIHTFRTIHVFECRNDQRHSAFSQFVHDSLAASDAGTKISTERKINIEHHDE